MLGVMALDWKVVIDRADNRDGEVTRLRELGAMVLQEVEEPWTEHVVMADPEGKEFCVQ